MSLTVYVLAGRERSELFVASDGPIWPVRVNRELHGCLCLILGVVYAKVALVGLERGCSAEPAARMLTHTHGYSDRQRVGTRGCHSHIVREDSWPGRGLRAREGCGYGDRRILMRGYGEGTAQGDFSCRPSQSRRLLLVQMPVGAPNGLAGGRSVWARLASGGFMSLIRPPFPPGCDQE